MFITICFGESEHGYGLWNMKLFNLPTVLDAVNAGEDMVMNENGEGFVVIHSHYDSGKNDDEAKVVYECNAEGMKVSTFPYIVVKKR